MKQALSLAVLSLLPSITNADWQPDKISLAYGHFISPFADRKAEIDQYRLGLVWTLSDEFWASILIAFLYKVMLNWP